MITFNNGVEQHWPCSPSSPVVQTFFLILGDPRKPEKKPRKKIKKCIWEKTLKNPRIWGNPRKNLELEKTIKKEAPIAMTVHFFGGLDFSYHIPAR